MHADRLRYLEITLSEWLFRAIDAAEVLTIDRDYFRLRSPLDRRLYELARKHCGSKERWRIGIDKLQKKCGSKQERKHFVRHMRETVAADRPPEYRVELAGDLVVFARRGEGASANGQARRQAYRGYGARRYAREAHSCLLQGHRAALRDGARLGQAYARKHVHRLGQNQGART
jgi:RNase P protein component